MRVGCQKPRPTAPAFGVLLLCGSMFAFASPVSAQPRDGGRIEVSGAARLIGALSFDGVPAEEVRPGGGTTALFTTASGLDGSIGPSASLGIALSRMLRAEVAFAYNSTSMTTHVSGDVEGIPDVSVSTPVRQFMIDGGLLAYLRRGQNGGAAPFVTGGLGYVRQLYDGRTLVETGASYYAGGGLYYERVPARPGVVKSAGLRADIRALFMRNGVNGDDAAHVVPMVTVGAFARF